jgi:hypothetical protein
VLDRVDNSIEIGVDIGVPEPQRAESHSAEDRIAHRVVIDVTSFGVLAPIVLDDEAVSEADEIQIEPEDRRLTAKVETG